MSVSLRIGLLQITAGSEPGPNAAAAKSMVAEAARGGAELALLPEVCNMIEPDRPKLREKVRPEADDETVAAVQAAARAAGIWVLIGSVVVDPEDGSGKLANRSLLIDGAGDVRGRYDKMHLFDVEIGSGNVYRESDTYRPGAAAPIVQTPWGRLGMTVCYDLRFPHLYRDLARQGCEMLTIPSAFTRPTGEAHWHVLMRARAIECGAFVLAPAQSGDHASGRKTYGHSLAVGPWGEILADGGDQVGITYADLDMTLPAEARARIPALRHDRPYTLDV
ncbi:MAG: carbon-nitrogen hydrolase family protein [Proteobacteria bacterium]|nr:carbon-nitrogen hydrolase family protein [Pseudomonadota bacterium]